MPWSMTGNYFQWYRDDPHLQGHTFNSYSYSFTGWFYHTSNRAGFITVFRCQNVPGNCCAVGQRILRIYQNSVTGFIFKADYDANPNYSNYLDYPGSTLLNQWQFVGASLSPTLQSLCFAYSPVDLNTRCVTFIPPSTQNQMWGTLTTSTLLIGDSYYGGIAGKVADVRYYFATALSVTDMEGLYQAKRGSVGVNCATLLTPFECSNCLSGCYLNSAGRYQQCNACCSACTGPGNTVCIGVCASPCQLVAGGACTRKQ